MKKKPKPGEETHTSEEKVAILRHYRHLSEGIPASEFPQDLSLPPTILEEWRKKFREHPDIALQEETIARLAKKLQAQDKALTELTSEHRAVGARARHASDGRDTAHCRDLNLTGLQ